MGIIGVNNADGAQSLMMGHKRLVMGHMPQRPSLAMGLCRSTCMLAARIRRRGHWTMLGGNKLN